MNEGKFIEYIEQGKIHCALCLQDKGSRLHLLTPTNREINLPVKRALLISRSGVDPSLSRETLLESLKQTQETRERLQASIDVRELWELVRDESETFAHEYLTQIVFGESVTDDHVAALLRALFDNHLYFKLSDGRFRPLSEEQVEQTLLQRIQEAQREEWLQGASGWLRSLWQGEQPQDPPQRQQVIDLLAQLVLHGSESPDLKLGKELLSRSGIQNIRNIRTMLVRLGVWDEDENLDILRMGVETDFGHAAQAEAIRLTDPRVTLEGREDLRRLEVVTIDGPLTQDFDDALSLEHTEDGLELGIHISDVASVIPPNSILDREAALRASSLYLPRTQASMIPLALSQDALSLREGHDRQAISLLARFHKDGHLTGYRFTPSLIHIRHRMTYEEADDVVNHKTPFIEMFRLCQTLRQARMNQGALDLSLPELHFRFNGDAPVAVELLDQNTPSRRIVSEFMILYNHLVALFCKENQIPILYRTQAEPSERLEFDRDKYLFYVFQQRRKLSPLLIDTEPKPHSGLGLEAYTQSTSPIRRYLDLVVQRQMRDVLMGTDPSLNGEKLEEIRLGIEPVLKGLETIKRNRLRYWSLKLLSHHMGQTYKAVVLDELRRRYRIVLCDLLLVAEVKRQEGTLFRPGQEILVQVKQVDPWEGVIELECVDQ